MYSKRVKSNVWGRLLEAFDSFCVFKSVNESDGLRDCVDIYIKYMRGNETRKLPTAVVGYGDKTFKRGLQSNFSGRRLADFSHICKARLMSEAEGLREAIRIATNYGQNDRGNRVAGDNKRGPEGVRPIG